MTQIQTQANAPVRVRRTQKRKKNALVDNALYIVLGLLCALLLIAVLYLTEAQSSLSNLRAQRESERAAYAQTVSRHVDTYRAYVLRYAEEYQLHPAFVAAVILRESSYRPDATSSVGARGLMQLMQGTASDVAGWLGVADYSFDRMYEPELNIRFGTRYLKYLSDKFDGDPVKTICAYHAGAGNVTYWLKSKLKTAYGMSQDEADAYIADNGAAAVPFALSDIPMSDTRDYARKVMNAYVIYYQNKYPDGAA